MLFCLQVGFYGESCELENPCVSNPCKEGQQCKLAPEISVEGPNYVCSDDGCATNPCKNDGVCSTDSKSKVSCECRSGFMGSFCELVATQCDSNPCKNGFCLPSTSGFFCICNRKYSFFLFLSRGNK